MDIPHHSLIKPLTFCYPIIMRESKRKKSERAVKVFELLKSSYPPVTTFLTHTNDFELLIAVILSAQCTDARVNIVTPALFSALPTPQAFADADLSTIKQLINSINFFNNKARNIQLTSQLLLDKHDGKVPQTLNELIELPGVGRKTANVILGQAFGVPGITVDTHVKRLSQRLGYSKQVDATKVEDDLIHIWPEHIWIDYSSLLILHGRNVCGARKPNCFSCILDPYCPKKNVNH